MRSSALCELCGRPASLHCASDSAFLCCDCDAKVHHANFLVARHVRELLCSLCNALSGDFFSGSDHISPHRYICRSCSPEQFSDHREDHDSLSSFSSSNKKISDSDDHHCRKLRKIEFESYSSTLTEEDSKFPGDGAMKFAVGDSAVRKKRRASTLRIQSNVEAKAEGVFVNWSRKFGVEGNAVASSASHALVICLGRLAVLPFRVALAGSFWFGLRLCGDKGASTWQQLSLLEEISGVPAKQILAVQSKLTRALRVDLKEGWDECSA